MDLSRLNLECERVQTFQRFLLASELSDEAAASQFEEAAVTNEVRGLLEEFLLLRRRIVHGLKKCRTSADRTPDEALSTTSAAPQRSPDGGRLSAHSVSWPQTSSSVSPLVQLMQLHSRLRLQMRPQQRAPSLDEWRLQQQQRDAQRRSLRKPQASPQSSAEDDFMEVSQLRVPANFCLVLKTRSFSCAPLGWQFGALIQRNLNSLESGLCLVMLTGTTRHAAAAGEPWRAR